MYTNPLYLFALIPSSFAGSGPERLPRAPVPPACAITIAIPTVDNFPDVDFRQRQAGEVVGKPPDTGFRCSIRGPYSRTPSNDYWSFSVPASFTGTVQCKANGVQSPKLTIAPGAPLPPGSAFGVWGQATTKQLPTGETIAWSEPCDWNGRTGADEWAHHIHLPSITESPVRTFPSSPVPDSCSVTVYFPSTVGHEEPIRSGNPGTVLGDASPEMGCHLGPSSAPGMPQQWWFIRVPGPFVGTVQCSAGGVQSPPITLAPGAPLPAITGLQLGLWGPTTYDPATHSGTISPCDFGSDQRASQEWAPMGLYPRNTN